MPSQPLAPAHPGYWLFGIIAVSTLAVWSPKIGGLVLLLIVLVLLGVGERRGTLPWSH